MHPTQWTLVLRASGEGEEARVALSDLCAAYYAPVVGFLRREGRSDDAARELAHEFFVQVLSGGVGKPDPSRGRFRSYLLGALKHFLGRRRAAQAAEKRGGLAEHVPWESTSEVGKADDTLAFDREWAMALIARALARLEHEHAGNPGHFAALKPWLDGGATRPQADAAQELGISPTAIKVTIHRMRTRFRELIRAEVCATLHDPADTGDELRHLIEVASQAG